MDDNIGLEHIVQEIRQSGAPLWLFGCSELGRYAGKVFLHMGIEVAGYMSSRIEGDGGLFEGKKVELPQKATCEKADAYVAICIFTERTAQQIEEQLRDMGYRNFISADTIVKAYLSLNLKPIGFRLAGGGYCRRLVYT